MRLFLLRILSFKGKMTGIVLWTFAILALVFWLGITSVKGSLTPLEAITQFPSSCEEFSTNCINDLLKALE